MPNFCRKPACDALTQIKSAGRRKTVAARTFHRYLGRMFTIEHTFDATVITLIDEGTPHLQEDVIVCAFEDCITVEQFDVRSNETLRLTLSLQQMRDLAAALNLPEGSYRLQPPAD